MTLTLKDSGSDRVKLLTLSPEEIAAARREAVALWREAAVPMESLRRIQGQLTIAGHDTPLLTGEYHKFRRQEPVLDGMEEPFGKLAKIFEKLRGDETAISIVVDSKEGLGKGVEALASRLMGRALEDKFTPELGEGATLEAMTDQEIGRQRLFLDGWTRTMQEWMPHFDAREQFRAKTLATRQLYTHNVVFVPDTIGVNEPHIREANIGRITGDENRYAFSFGVITRRLHDKNGPFEVKSALYTLDKRLLDAMHAHGGDKMRDTLLRAFQTAAAMADHDYIHGSVVVDGTLATAPLHAANRTRELDEAYFKTAQTFEDHAFRSHKEIQADIIDRTPKIEETLLCQAAGFGDALALWEQKMREGGVAEGKARGMTSALAKIYLERMLTRVPFDDPSLRRPVTTEEGEARSVAESLGRFAPLDSRRIKWTNGSDFKTLYNAMQADGLGLAQIKLHGTDDVLSGGKRAPTEQVTSQYQRAFHSVIDRIGLTPSESVARHVRGKEKVLSLALAKDVMREKLGAEAMAGKKGPIETLNAAALKAGLGTEASRALRDASDALEESLLRADRAIESGAAGRGARSESDLPRAIDGMLDALKPLKAHRRLAVPAASLAEDLNHVKHVWHEQVKSSREAIQR